MAWNFSFTQEVLRERVAASWPQPYDGGGLMWRERPAYLGRWRDVLARAGDLVWGGAEDTLEFARRSREPVRFLHHPGCKHLASTPLQQRQELATEVAALAELQGRHGETATGRKGRG